MINPCLTSKENGRGTVLWLFAWATAFLTAFYIFHLIDSAGIHAHAPHESGPLLSRSISPILITLMLIFLGYFALPFIGLNWFEHFLTPVMGGSGATHKATLVWSVLVTVVLSVAVVLSGWLIPYFYIGGTGWIANDRLTEKLNLLYVFFFNKGYADDVYQALVIAPILNLSYRMRKGEADGPIDRLAKRVGDRLARSRPARTPKPSAG